MSQRALADFLVEQFAPLGHASARAMFGGFSVYIDGVIVALVADDTAYLKTDARTRPDFEAAGSEPFTYEGTNGPVAMSYWSIPPDVLEEPEALRDWAAKARAASLRARGDGPARRRVKSAKRARQPRRIAGSRRARR